MKLTDPECAAMSTALYSGLRMPVNPSCAMLATVQALPSRTPTVDNLLR